MPPISPTPAGRALPQTGAASVYREQEILTASPAQLILILYDHALASLAKGAQLADAGDLRLAGAQFGRAAATILELLGSLDMEAGGELAAHLANLYGFWAPAILKLQVEYDRRTLDRITGQMLEMRTAFAGAMESIKEQAIASGMLAADGQPTGPKGDTEAAARPSLAISG